MSLFALAWLVAAHYVRPAKYTATTVFERRSDAASPDQTSNGPESVQALRLTMEQDLKGFDAVAQAAEDLGLTRGLPHDEQGKLTPAGEAQKQELVQELVENTSVTRVESPAVDRVSVSFTGADPRLVQHLPDTLVRNYISRISNEIVSRLTESKKFLAHQADDGKRQVQELTASLIEFEMRHAGTLPEDPGAIQEVLQRIAADMDTVRRQQAEAQRSVAKLKRMLAARKPTDREEPVQDDLDLQLASAESSAEVTTIELERLQARQSLYQNLMANFGPVRQEYLKLTADLAQQEAKTKEWETRLSDVEMALAAEVAKRGTHLNAIQAAQPQYRPESPELWAVLVIALIGGVLTGVACVVRPIRFSPRGRLLLTLALLVAMVGTGLSMMSSVLWLEYPDEHERWKAAPASYLAAKAAAAWTWVSDGL
jgi:uncharacterized protein involved in exopolysaccharide biosynthesis